MTIFQMSSSCFLRDETYHFRHPVGEQQSASTAEVTAAGVPDATESIFQMMKFGHLHRYLPNYLQFHVFKHADVFEQNDFWYWRGLVFFTKRI